MHNADVALLDRSIYQTHSYLVFCQILAGGMHTEAPYLFKVTFGQPLFTISQSGGR